MGFSVLCASREVPGGSPFSTEHLRGSPWAVLLGVGGVSVAFPARHTTSLPPYGTGVSQVSSPPRVSVPLLKMLDQMLANGCFDIFTAEEE